MINADHSIQVIAQTSIAEGDQITNQYMKADKPTSIRRPFLREKWFFDCMCPRCADPTECGSHLSSLLCPRPRCQGSVVPSHPLDYESSWACLTCGCVQGQDRVQTVLEGAAALLDCPAEGAGVVEHYEKMLHQLASQLHPYNHLMLGAKQKLALLYGNIPQYSMDTMARPAKQRKMQLCMDVIDCLGKVRLPTL